MDLLGEGVLADISIADSRYSLSTRQGDVYQLLAPEEFIIHKPVELILFVESGNNKIFPKSLITTFGDIICSQFFKYPELVFYYWTYHNGIGTVEDLIRRYLEQNNRGDVVFLSDHKDGIYYGFLFSSFVPLRVNLESQFNEIKNNL